MTAPDNVMPIYTSIQELTLQDKVRHLEEAIRAGAAERRLAEEKALLGLLHLLRETKQEIHADLLQKAERLLGQERPA